MADSDEQAPQAQRGRGGRQQLANPNHVHVNARRPVSVYTALTRRLLGQHEEVHVLGVGTGVSSAASVVELLKSDGLALVTNISTSLVLLPAIPSRGMLSTQKPKLEVVITKLPDYAEIIQQEKEQRAELIAAQVAAHEAATATADALGNLAIAGA